LTPRRELGAALLTCSGGAALALFAAGRVWARATVAESTAGLPVELTGRELAPAVASLALVGLVGALALLATRSAGRRVAGALLVLTGLGLAVAAAAGAGRADQALAREAGAAVGTHEAATSPPQLTGWPWLAGSGGLVLAAVGGLAVAHGPRWPGLSARYEAPSAAQEPDGMWQALDRGEDPTA